MLLLCFILSICWFSKFFLLDSRLLVYDDFILSDRRRRSVTANKWEYCKQLFQLYRQINNIVIIVNLSVFLPDRFFFCSFILIKILQNVITTLVFAKQSYDFNLSICAAFIKLQFCACWCILCMIRCGLNVEKLN